MNRIFTERIKAMLRIAGKPNSFWVEVAKIACYVVNQSPSVVQILMYSQAHESIVV